MTVRIKNLNSGQVSNVPATFSDNFDRSTGLGSDWLYQTVLAVPGTLDFQGTNIVSNKLRWVHYGGGTGANSNAGIFIPRVYSNLTALWGKKQFSQATWVGTFGASVQAGVSGFIRWDYELQQYYSITVIDNTKFIVDRANGPNLRTLLYDSTVGPPILGAPVAGDVFRLEIVPGGGGVNTLTCKQNGVTFFTVADSNLSQIGAPGVNCFYTSPAGFADWDDFLCGRF